MWKLIIVGILVVIGYIGLRVWVRRTKRRTFLQEEQEKIRQKKIERERKKTKNTPKKKLLRKFNNRYKRR
jgi:uncharacterized membrane-anchored protein YhcB (DUF1043 family)